MMEAVVKHVCYRLRILTLSLIEFFKYETTHASKIFYQVKRRQIFLAEKERAEAVSNQSDCFVLHNTIKN